MPYTTGLFEIVGPAMIGPSSSHTAGAVRIGRIVRRLLGEPVKSAQIGLHGSFAATYRGHGTDRALIGGLLGMAVDDVRIRHSLSEAERENVEFTFTAIELKNAHPNTTVITVRGASGESVEVRASSIGGGSILVNAIDGIEVDFSGDSDTLIVRHRDAPGAIAKVCSALAGVGINIAAMKMSRTEPGQAAIMVLELDALPGMDAIALIDGMEFTDVVTLLRKNM